MVVDALVVGGAVVVVVVVDEISTVVVAATASVTASVFLSQCPQDFLQTFGICVFVLSQ